jgi:hypothetical protein
VELEQEMAETVETLVLQVPMELSPAAEVAEGAMMVQPQGQVPTVR